MSARLASSHAVSVLSAALLAAGVVAYPAAMAEPQTPIESPPGQVIVSDYCDSLYFVSGLGIGGDGYLSVRVVPRAGAHEIYRLHRGAQVSVCQTTADGKWHGIIFKPRELSTYDDDCVVTESPSGKAEEYDLQSLPGPCLTGWVSARYLESAAG